MTIAKKRILLLGALALVTFGLCVGSALPRSMLWAAGGHGGMDMGGGDGTTVITGTGLQLTYAAFPGEPLPGEDFRAVLIVTNDSMPLDVSPILIYEFISADPTQTEVGTVGLSMLLPGVFEAKLALRYAGLYRLTYTFTNNDAVTTHVALQGVALPHAHQDGALGELEADLENYNELAEAAGQKLEFELEGDDVVTAAGEIVVHIQDQSGLLDLGTRVLTLSPDGHYETPADIDFSGGAPKWDITIETQNFGAKTFTIQLPN